MASSGKEVKLMDDDEVVGLDEIDDETTVKIKSKEGRVFELKKKAAMMSKLIRSALENDKQNRDTEMIELAHIESDTVQKIIDYVTYHSKIPPRNIEKPLTSNNLKDLVDEWDAKYTDVDQDTMFKVLLAANYMHIQPLLLLMCAKVATLMKGKTPDEIKDVFGIRKDVTPEEEEEVRKQYKDLLD